MAVLDHIPGIGVVVRIRGDIVEEYPGPQPYPGAVCPYTSKFIESFDDTEFSVGIAVDELYDFARDEDHCLCFSVTVDGERLAASCDITQENVTAGYGRARRTVDRAASYDEWTGCSYVQKFRFPIVERGMTTTTTTTNLPCTPQLL
ncbi:hypothetical protein PG993_009057 [Apiospora rasikravindrae]|uniref:DUF7918 domain-containing protein n=1 Tax=Apiospora rasikravindrae TaxID=990691 RepID=A0ABR1SIB9_9PEZI